MNRKHGYSTAEPRLYRIWKTMKARCNNTHRAKFAIYGGRGIRVCDEWSKSPAAFVEWALDNGYRDGLQIDRIDVNGGYSPDNCRWVTPLQNARNRRNNRRLVIDGISKCVTEWIEGTDISRFTVYWWMNQNGAEYAADRIKAAMEKEGAA